MRSFFGISGGNSTDFQFRSGFCAKRFTNFQARCKILKITVINGPNLNMLGMRDRSHYGGMTLEELNAYVREYCAARGVETEFLQSNFEGEIVGWIQRADCDAMILNAGAYTHYSYAIRDAIECRSFPVAEVHLSDIHSREPFRHVSVLEPVCAVQIAGKKERSYTEAVDFLISELGETLK